jgi:hypothetical protein
MLSDILNDKYISTALTIMVGLYAATLGPNLPPSIKDLFSNSIFKMIVLFLVVVRANKNPTMSIVIAVAFVMILENIQKKDAFSAFTSVGYKLGENYCVEEPELVENPIEIEKHVQYLDEIENMANISYLENELDENLPFEDFIDVDYKIDTESVVESDIAPLYIEDKASVLEMQSHFEYLDSIDNMSNVQTEENQVSEQEMQSHFEYLDTIDNMSNVETFVSM